MSAKKIAKAPAASAPAPSTPTPSAAAASASATSTPAPSVPVTATIVRPERPGRNEPCHCGSGKKYKKCHLDADEAADRKLYQQAVAKAAAAAAAEAAEEKDEKASRPAHAKPEREHGSSHAPNRNSPGKAIFQRKVGGS